MARDFFINGETMVSVKGATGTSIANLSELGLAADPIRVTPDFRHSEITLDAWGEIPADFQFKLAGVNISMTLIHFDRTVMDECLRLAMGGPTTVGMVARAGTRIGNNTARFAAGNRFISLNLYSPISGKPWRFYSSVMTGPPMEFPLGTEKSIVVVNWRVIPFTTDPWQGGLGAANQILWDHVLDG